jgi:hypothetical protein
LSGPAVLAPAIALIWAGVALGVAMIAAPAKFQAPSLTLPVALDVGRAQFLWGGISEGVLCVAFVVALALFGGIKWRWAVLPVVLYAIQRLVVMPPLDARTVQIIAGETLAPSNLHLVFITLEVAKIVVLIAVGVVGLMAMRRAA